MTGARSATARRMLAAAVFLLASFAAQPVARAACEAVWTNPTNGTWNTAANWSGTFLAGDADDIPDADDEVCIQVAGSYTVTVAANAAAQTVTLGSAVGGQERLLIQAQTGSSVTLTVGNGVQVSSILELQSNGISRVASLVNTNGTLINDGVVRTSFTVNSMDVPAIINSSIGNAGTFDLDHRATTSKANGNWSNVGTIQLGTGVGWTLAGIPSGLGTFTMETGTIDGGRLNFESTNIVWDDGARTNGVITVEASMLDASGPGPATFHVNGTQSELSGNIDAEKTVVLDAASTGPRTLSASGDRTNEGVISLNAGGGFVGTISFGTNDLFNQGLIQSTGSGGANSLDAVVRNEAGGTLDVAHSVGNSSGVFNAGQIDVAPGKSFTVDDFQQTGGQTNVDGTLSSSADLQLGGGVLSGTGVLGDPLDQTGGILQPGTSAGVLTVQGDYTQTGGTLSVEVEGPDAGTGHDQLDVNGIASLEGSLAIDAAGFVPAPGQTFDVLTSTSRSGGFASVSGQESGGRPLMVQYGATTATLVGIDVAVSGGKAREGKPVTFTVSLDRPTSVPLTIQYETDAGKAKAKKDFVARSGSLSFAPGESLKTVKVKTKKDARDEKKESFAVDVTSGGFSGTAPGVIKNRPS